MPLRLLPSWVTRVVIDHVHAVHVRTACVCAAGSSVSAQRPKFITYELVEALSQEVAGTNYFIKVRISPPGAPTEHIALRIFQPLPHTGAPPELVSMLRDEAVPTPLQYFE